MYIETNDFCSYKIVVTNVNETHVVVFRINHDFVVYFSFTYVGIVVGLNNRLLQVTEGVNKTINLCGFLENLTAIWKANLSGLLLITNSSTAEGLYVLLFSIRLKILFYFLCIITVGY